MLRGKSDSGIETAERGGEAVFSAVGGHEDGFFDLYEGDEAYGAGSGASSSSSLSGDDSGDSDEDDGCCGCCGCCMGCCLCTRRGRREWARRWIPRWMREYGKTTYGGDPLLQQTLPTYFNYASPFWFMPAFLAFAVTFIVLGVFIILASRKRYLLDVEYGNVSNYQYYPADPAVNINQGIRSFSAEGQSFPQGTRTRVTFNITQTMRAPVYFLYTIRGMHQNHRDWGDGRSTAQLSGSNKAGKSGGSLCRPFDKVGALHDGDGSCVTVTNSAGATERLDRFYYYPCGIAPWSMFNDTLTLYRGDAAGGEPLELVCNGSDFGPRGERLGGSAGENRCNKDGIEWKADRTIRFKPVVTHARAWSPGYPHLPTNNDYLNNGWYYREAGHALPDPMDYDLHVWLRSAVVSNFRKPYRVIETDLPPGPYTLEVDEFYDVTSFRGRKGIALRTASWVGEDNTPLGAAFIACGAVAAVFFIAFGLELLRRLLCRGRPWYERWLSAEERPSYVFPRDMPEFELYYGRLLRRQILVKNLLELRRRDAAAADGTTTTSAGGPD